MAAESLWKAETAAVRYFGSPCRSHRRRWPTLGMSRQWGQEEESDETVLDRCRAVTGVRAGGVDAGSSCGVPTGVDHPRKAGRLQSQCAEGQYPAKRPQRDGRQRKDADAVRV